MLYVRFFSIAFFIFLALSAPSAAEPEIDLNDEFYQNGLREFNKYQTYMGNPETKLDLRLVKAAQMHAAYLARNHLRERITLAWHNEVRRKPGFIGKDPGDQAKAMGFTPSPGYYVTNTLGSFSDYDLFSTPEYSWHHLASTIYHRTLIAGAPYEAIGFYRYIEPKSNLKMLVLFGSVRQIPEVDRVVKYPGAGQTEVPLAMLQELPKPFAKARTGFPITLFLSTADYKKNIVLVSAEMTDPAGKKLPLLKLTPQTPGEAGKYAKMLKLVSVAAENPLKPNTEYKIKMKAKDSAGNIIFDEAWTFTTGDEKPAFSPQTEQGN